MVLNFKRKTGDKHKIMKERDLWLLKLYPTVFGEQQLGGEVKKAGKGDYRGDRPEERETERSFAHRPRRKRRFCTD